MENAMALWKRILTLRTFDECKEFLSERLPWIDKDFIKVGPAVAEALVAGGLHKPAEFVCEIGLYSCSLIQEDTAGPEGGYMAAKAHVYHDLGNYEEALALCDKAQDYFQQQEMFKEAAFIKINKASIYDDMGDHQRALGLYNTVRDYLLEHQVLKEVAVIELNQVEVFCSLGRYEEALASCNKAQEYFQQQQMSEDVKSAVMKKAGVYLHLGRYEDALDLYDEAQDYFHQHQMLRKVAIIDMNKAVAYYELGCYEDALALYGKAQGYFQQERMFRQLASIDMKKAYIYSELGNLEKALALIEKAQDYFQQQQIFEELARAEVSKANIYHKLGRNEEALAFYDKAQKYFQKHRIPKEIARIEVNKAIIYSIMGHHEEALVLCDQARDYFQQQEMSKVVAGIEVNKAHIYCALRQYEDALASCKRAVASCNRAVDDRDIPHVRWRLYYIGGVAFQRRAGSAYNLHRAYKCYEHSIEIIESWRSGFTHDQMKISFLYEKESAYAQMVNLLVSQGKVKEAYEYAERSKSRALLDLVCQAKDRIRVKSSSNNEHTNMFQTEHPCETPQNGKKEGTRFVSGFVQATHAPPGVLADERVQTVRSDNVQSSRLELVQSMLSSDVALIEYYCQDNTFVIFAVTQDGVEIYSETKMEDVREQITALLFDKVTGSGNRVKAHIKQYEHKELAQANLRELHELLITPIEDYIDNKERLIIVPHGILHNLPFAALHDGEQYLVQKKIISVSPSSSILSALQKDNIRQRESCVAFINPMINPEYDTLRHADNPGAHFAESQYHEYEREYATIANVREHVIGKHVIHFHCHAVFDPRDALYSCLLLSNGNPEKPVADPMYTADVFSLDLSSASLVVLSGCSTTKGRMYPGDELVALTRGFFYAGASSVLASLWDVADEATGHLMSLFYGIFKDKKQPLDKATALQYSQKLLLDEFYDHPYFWAGFELIGDWR